MKKLHALVMVIVVMAMSVAVASAATRTEQQKVLASDPAFNVFGFPIAQDGNTAVVGARFANLNQGDAYVFERMGGQWTEKQKLTASDGTPFEFFGTSVAIRGNTILVGASNAFNANRVGSGAVYVFEKVAGAWVETQKLSDNTSGAAVNDAFGIFTGIEGNTLIVGASNHDGSGFQSGILHVFEKSATTWVEVDRLLPSDTAAGDRFGLNVAMEGDTIVVGAPKVGFFGVPIGAGSAYVFTRSATGWSEEAKLTAGGAGVVNNRFGFRVALAGNTVVVGAPESGINGPNEDAGSVYVFTRAGNDWSQQARLTASDGAIGDRFGTGLAVSDNTVVVGATAHNSAQGEAYIFERSGTVWSEGDKLVASDAIQGTSLGEAVAISGNDILVGASNIDWTVPPPTTPRTGPGAVYVFER